jgi:hypothetical protein
MWLASKTPDEESQTISYLWRIEPFTDRRGGGKPTSIEKYARIIDPIVVRDEHGSGNYRLDVCHIPKNGGASTRQRQIYFNVMHPDYPPKIPYGEWINDPANERWKWAEPKLRETAGDIHGTNGANGQVPNPQGMFSTILEGVRTLRGDTSESSGLATAVIDMVRDNQDEMRKLSNPATQLGALKELLAVIQPKPSEEGGGLKYVVDLLMKQNDRLADELKESRIAAAAQAKPRNFLEEVREFLPALKEINSSLGMGPKSSNGHTDWGSIIGNVVEKIGDRIPELAQAYMFSMQHKAATAPNGTATPKPKARVLPIGAGNGTQPAAEASTGTTRIATPDGKTMDVPTEQIEEEQDRMQKILDKYGPLIMDVAPTLVDKFAHENGYNFREWFIDRHTLETWQQLKDECGPHRLAALAQWHPIMKVKLAPPEDLIVFLTEFFTVRGQEPAGVEEVVEGAEADASAGPK